MYQTSFVCHIFKTPEQLVMPISSCTLARLKLISTAQVALKGTILVFIEGIDLNPSAPFSNWHEPAEASLECFEDGSTGAKTNKVQFQKII
jgi:hypothetical protein